MGFQITEEDVVNVLKSHNAFNAHDINMEDIMSMIDDDEISKAALDEDIDDDEVTLTKQTDVAYDVIAKQLLNFGYITVEQVKEYGNVAILD